MARGPNKKKQQNPSTIQISVKVIEGKWVTLHVAASDTVSTLKSMISDKQGDRDVQRLIFGGRQLEDDRTVSDYNIQTNSNLFEEGRLCGGARNAADVPEQPQDNIESNIDLSTIDLSNRNRIKLIDRTLVYRTKFIESN